jgi:hypothetical protein
MIQVRPRGWGSAKDWTVAPFDPVESSNLTRVSGMDETGRCHFVASERRDGRLQVILRSGNAEGWSEEFQVSSSSGAAIDPALAVLPGGDLAVVWSDTRDGRSVIYYRSRVLGTWTPERALTRLPGEARTPAIGCDATGTLAVAFRYLEPGATSIQFMRFTYYSPFATPIRLTADGDRPENPGVAMSRDGSAWVLWKDRLGSNHRIWFRRYRPQSGFEPTLPLVAAVPEVSQTAYSALVDPQGTLHVVWLISGPGLNQLHYQRRPDRGEPDPEDVVVESRGDVIQNPNLALDRDGGLHLVFENSRDGRVRAYYRRWQADGGWDAASTVLTSESWDTRRPLAFPTAGGDLSVLYISFPVPQPRLMLMRRDLTRVPSVTVGPTAAATSPVRLVLSPNPLRAGATIGLRIPIGSLSPSPSPSIDFYDLGGRRVAEVLLVRTVEGWSGKLPGVATRDWTGGVYFARVRGGPDATARAVVLR